MRLIPTVKTITIPKDTKPMTENEFELAMKRMEAEFLDRIERLGFGALFDITPVEEPNEELVR